MKILTENGVREMTQEEERAYIEKILNKKTNNLETNNFVTKKTNNLETNNFVTTTQSTILI